MKMKTILMISLMILSANFSYSQEKFVWERIDSVYNDKNQIYSDTKIFITETWKSAKDVIQLDDKENGIIVLKALINPSSSSGRIFWYSYTIKFLFKDKKYKVDIQDVKYHSGTFENFSYLILDPQEEYPGVYKAGIFKKEWESIMNEIKSTLSNIVSGYEKALKTNSTNSNW